MAIQGDSPATAEWTKHAAASTSQANAQIIQGSLFKMLSQRVSQWSGVQTILSLA